MANNISANKGLITSLWPRCQTWSLLFAQANPSHAFKFSLHVLWNYMVFTCLGALTCKVCHVNDQLLTSDLRCGPTCWSLYNHVGTIIITENDDLKSWWMRLLAVHFLFKHIFQVFSVVSWENKYLDTWPQGLSLDEVYVSLLRVSVGCFITP